MVLGTEEGRTVVQKMITDEEKAFWKNKDVKRQDDQKSIEPDLLTHKLGVTLVGVALYSCRSPKGFGIEYCVCPS